MQLTRAIINHDLDAELGLLRDYEITFRHVIKAL